MATLKVLQSDPADQLRQWQTNVFMISSEEQSARNLRQMLTRSRIIITSSSRISLIIINIVDVVVVIVAVDLLTHGVTHASGMT